MKLHFVILIFSIQCCWAQRSKNDIGFGQTSITDFVDDLLWWKIIHFLFLYHNHLWRYLKNRDLQNWDMGRKKSESSIFSYVKKVSFSKFFLDFRAFSRMRMCFRCRRHRRPCPACHPYLWRRCRWERMNIPCRWPHCWPRPGQCWQNCWDYGWKIIYQESGLFCI